MVLAVFNNRTQALQFAGVLKGMTRNVRVINTPREISVSCGLSVMFSEQNLKQARVIINGGKFSSLRGLYIKKNNGRMYYYEKIM